MRDPDLTCTATCWKISRAIQGINDSKRRHWACELNPPAVPKLYLFPFAAGCKGAEGAALGGCCPQHHEHKAWGLVPCSSQQRFPWQPASWLLNYSLPFKKWHQAKGTTHPQLPMVLDFSKHWAMFNFLMYLVIVFGNLVLDLFFFWYCYYLHHYCVSIVLWNAKKVKSYLKHRVFLVAGGMQMQPPPSEKPCWPERAVTDALLGECWSHDLFYKMCQTCYKKPQQSYPCCSLWNWVFSSCCAGFSCLMGSCRYQHAVLRADTFFILLHEQRLQDIFLQLKKGEKMSIHLWYWLSLLCLDQCRFITSHRLRNSFGIQLLLQLLEGLVKVFLMVDKTELSSDKLPFPSKTEESS